MKPILILITLFFSAMSYCLDYGDEAMAKELELLGAQIPDGDADFVEVDPDLDKTIHFLGENDSFSGWNKVSTEDYLSIDKWLKQRELKDKNKYWLEKVTNGDYTEKVGRVLKCVGNCYKYGETNKVKAQYLTQIHEGDELQTMKDSMLWLVMVDGSIIRLAAETSISINEINISRNRILSIIRLNNGYISLRQRSSQEFPEVNLPETDLSFSPLMLLEANRGYYIRKEYGSLEGEREKIRYQVMQNPGAQFQYRTLNRFIKKNNKWFEKKDIHTIVYSPTASFYLKKTDLDLFYELGKKSYFFLTSHEEKDERENFVQIRGYENAQKHFPEYKRWMQTDPDGRELADVQGDDRFRLNASKALTARIPSILLAREIWMHNYSRALFEKSLTPEMYARTLGYRLWNIENPKELELRQEFAFEYIRRVETSNIVGLKSFYNEYAEVGFTPSYYARSMKEHYLALRELNNRNKIKIKNMNRSQYYLWVLQHE